MIFTIFDRLCTLLQKIKNHKLIIIAVAKLVHEKGSKFKTYNHVHNILRLRDGWASSPFDTSEKKCDY